MTGPVVQRRRPDGAPGRVGPLAAAALWSLLAAAMTVGLWAQLAPASFYADFPGPRHSWVSLDGPFNEHLVRDVGGLHLALAVLTAAAAVSRAVPAVRAVACGWLVYAVPHLLYHATHLEPFSATDAVGQVVALSLQVVAPAGLLIASRPGSPSR